MGTDEPRCADECCATDDLLTDDNSLRVRRVFHDFEDTGPSPIRTVGIGVDDLRIHRACYDAHPRDWIVLDAWAPTCPEAPCEEPRLAENPPSGAAAQRAAPREISPAVRAEPSIQGHPAAMWVGLFVTTLVAVIDWMVGNSMVLIGLLIAGPIISTATLRLRSVAVVSGWAIALAVMLGLPNGIAGDREHLALAAAVAATGVFAMAAAFAAGRTLNAVRRPS